MDSATSGFVNYCKTVKAMYSILLRVLCVMFIVQGLAIMDFQEAVLMTSFLGQRLVSYNK